MNTQLHFMGKQNILWIILFILLIAIAYFIYMQGVTGVFLFDDFPNLSPLGKYTDYSFWDRFWLFLLEGHSGPTGRPISLASFFLNDSNWPSQPSYFIETNILIHLLNGVLVFCLSIKLTHILDLPKSKQISLSLFTTAFWLLHPMQTTTVLYIIQRMTELSATFTLTGIIFYLYGRDILIKNRIKGLLLLYVVVGSSLIFAILSKENGILLVAYILIVEFFLLRPFKIAPPAYFNYWLFPAVVFPFVCILLYLGLRTDPDAFANRNFSLVERLLTEPRILFEYLSNILLPNMNGFTLFHDDYLISRNIFAPWTTLPSIIGVFSLITFSFILRKNHPLISFSIAWFFAGHLIESTVLPLELYFEHRNYLPLLGISFTFAWYISNLGKKYKLTVLTIACFILLFNSFIVLQNTNLWGKPLELSINWYMNHPKSERAKETYLMATKVYGVPQNLVNNNKKINNKESMFFTSTLVYELSEACLKNEVNKEMLDSTLLQLKNNIIQATTSNKMMDFLSYWQAGKCNNLQNDDIEAFLLKLTSLKNMKRNNIFLHDIFYSLSVISRKKKDFNSTMTYLDKAYSNYPNSEILKLRVGYLLSAGLYDKALKVLSDTSLLENSFRKKLAMKIKQKELNQLKQLILKKRQKEAARKIPQIS